jgi:heat shock protein HtpX
MFVLGWTGSWLLAVGAIAALFAFLLYLPSVSERVALASARAREVSAQEEPGLHALVGRLAAMADLPMPRIAVAPTEVPNAFTAGRSPRDAVVVVTRGLLSRLSDRELEAVLAHELAHVEGRDAFVMTLVSAPAVLGARFVSWAESIPRSRRHGRQGAGRVRPPLLPLAALPPWVLYAIAVAIVRTISRYREFVADRGAVLLTGAPEQLMSALQRVAADLPLIPKEDLRKVAGASALFIVPAEPAGGFSIDPGRLFPSHPPLEERLERLSDLSRELGRPAGSKVTRVADAGRASRSERWHCSSARGCWGSWGSSSSSCSARPTSALSRFRRSGRAEACLSSRRRRTSTRCRSRARPALPRDDHSPSASYRRTGDGPRRRSSQH